MNNSLINELSVSFSEDSLAGDQDQDMEDVSTNVT